MARRACGQESLWLVRACGCESLWLGELVGMSPLKIGAPHPHLMPLHILPCSTGNTRILWSLHSTKWRWEMDRASITTSSRTSAQSFAS